MAFVSWMRKINLFGEPHGTKWSLLMTVSIGRSECMWEPCGGVLCPWFIALHIRWSTSYGAVTSEAQLNAFRSPLSQINHMERLFRPRAFYGHFASDKTSHIFNLTTKKINMFFSLQWKHCRNLLRIWICFESLFFIVLRLHVTSDDVQNGAPCVTARQHIGKLFCIFNDKRYKTKGTFARYLRQIWLSIVKHIAREISYNNVTASSTSGHHTQFISRRALTA